MPGTIAFDCRWNHFVRGIQPGQSRPAIAAIDAYTLRCLLTKICDAITPKIRSVCGCGHEHPALVGIWGLRLGGIRRAVWGGARSRSRARQALAVGHGESIYTELGSGLTRGAATQVVLSLDALRGLRSSAAKDRQG